MNTRRILALVLSLLMCMSAFSITAFAAEGTVAVNSPELDVSTSAQPVTLTLNLTANPGMVSLKYKVSYDATYLTMKSYETGAFITDNGFTDFTRKNADLVPDKLLSWGNDLSEDDITETGTLCSIGFEVKENAPAGTYNVEFTCQEAWDAMLSDVTSKFGGATAAITVKSATSSTFDVKFMNGEAQVGTTQSIEKDAFATAPVNPTKAPSHEYYYTFRGWSTNGTDVADVSTTPITAATTFTALYTETAHPATLTKEYGKGGTIPDIVKGGTTVSANVITRTSETFNGVDCMKMVPYTEADAQEGNFSIEGYSRHPTNKSVDGKGNWLDYGTYPYVLVRYFYNPGTNADARTASYSATNYNRTPLVENGKTGPGMLTSGYLNNQWAYQTYNFTAGSAAAFSSIVCQFHFQMGFTRAQAAITGEEMYIDKIMYSREPISVYDVTFVNGDGTTPLYKTQVISTDKVGIYYGAATPSKATDDDYIYSFNGNWTIDGTNPVNLSELTVTEATTIKPMFNSAPKTGTTYEVKFEANGTQVGTTQNIAENAFATAPTETPTKLRDAAKYYTFDGWYDGATKVADFAAYAITKNTTFVANFTETAHTNPLVWNPTDTSFVNNVTFFLDSNVDFKGVNAVKYVPNPDRTEQGSINIEGAGQVPANKSSIKGSTMYDPTIYKTVAVRYYYDAGTNAETRQLEFWNQTSNWQDTTLVAVPTKVEDMTSGKWTYVLFDYSEDDLTGKDCNVPQFHVRPFKNIKSDAIADTNEIFYLDSVEWFLDAPEVYTVKFNDGTNDLYEIDVIAGEEPVFFGETPTSAEGDFVGWATTKGATEALTSLAVTEATTFYPVFGVKPTPIVYVSSTGLDANDGSSPEKAMLTLKAAIKKAATLAPNSEDSAVVLVCGDGQVAGGLEGLKATFGTVTVTSKYGSEDYTDTAAAISLMNGQLDGSYANYGYLIFQDIKINVADSQQWSFVCMNNYHVDFLDNVVVVASDLSKYNIKFRVGGESGNVDYDKFSSPLTIKSGRFGSVHLGSKNTSTTNNINFVWSNPVIASINVGNDSVSGKTVDTNGGVITGYTKLEINQPVSALSMGWIKAHNADYSVIFNNGVASVNPSVVAPNDDNTYKKFIIKAGEGFILHNTATVGEYAVEAKPEKAYTLINGKEETIGNTISFVDSNTYVLSSADYKVTFKNGANTLETDYVNSGATVSFDGTTPTNGDKQFSGWALSTAPTAVVALDTYVLSADVEFVAVFTDNVTVKFMNGSEQVGEDTVLPASGGEVTFPAAPTVPEHKSFKGWSADNTNFYQPAASLNVTENKTFNAVFEDIEYTVTFGTTQIKGIYDADKNAPAAPTAEAGKEFAGWKNDADAEDVIAAGAAFKIKATATYTATWNDIKYTVNFTDGATATFADKVYNEEIIVPAYTGSIPTGKSFKEWSNGDATTVAAGATYKVTKNTTFTAVFENIEYTVTFGTTQIKGIYDADKNAPAAPTAEAGKEFAGWKNDADAEDVIAAGAAFKIKAAATYTATWNDIKYTVNFTDGATATFADKVYNEEITVPAYTGSIPEGQYFKEWSDGDATTVAAGAKYKVTKNITFTAVFASRPSYNVVFKNGTDTVDTKSGYENDVINAFPEAPTPAAGYKFKGWKLEGTEDTALITTYIIGTASVNILAVFEALPKVVVTVNGVAQDSYNGGAITLPTSATGGTGRFIGWTTVSGGTTVTHAAGSQYIVGDEAVVFYPVFSTNTASYTAEGQYTVGTGKYVVDLYFDGDKTNAGGFGIDYLDTMTLDSFEFASGIAEFGFTGGSYKLDDSENNFYGNVFYGAGATPYIDATEAAVKIGTFTFTMSRSDYEATTPTERIKIGTPDTEFSEGKLYGDNSFKYSAHNAADPLNVIYSDITLESVSDKPIIETLVTVSGTFKANDRSADAVAANVKNATLNIYVAGGDTPVKTITITESATSKIANYSVEIPVGNYDFEFVKTGYLTVKVPVTVAEDMDPVAEVVAYAGDVKDSATGKDEKVDLADFIRVIRGFDTSVAADANYVKEADLDETGAITIEDIVIVKANFGKVGA